MRILQIGAKKIHGSSWAYGHFANRLCCIGAEPPLHQDARSRPFRTPLIVFAGPLGDQIGTMGVIKTELQPSDREVAAGLFERVTYQKADNGFCVIRVKATGSP
jgi:hypothetical protein